MLDFPAYRRAAFRYWELRRIWYNLALVLPAFVGYAAGPSSADLLHLANLNTAWGLVLCLACALLANICYTFIYALEFAFGTEDPHSAWRFCGRVMCFVCGTLIAMALAFIGGHDIRSTVIPW